ncbi:hypothetical protein MT390_19420 [Vibrio sp. 2-Bac 85]
MKKCMSLITLLPFYFLHYSVLAEEIDYNLLYNSSELVNNLTDDIYQNSPNFNVELIQEVDKYLPSLINLHKNGSYKKLDHELEMLRSLINDVSLINEEAYVNGNLEFEVARSHFRKPQTQPQDSVNILNQETMMDNSGHVFTNREMQKQNMRKKIISKKNQLFA